MLCQCSGLPDVWVDRGNWDGLRAAVEARSGFPATDLEAMLVYSVCPAGFITPLSGELLRLYYVLGGTSRLAKPSEYYDLPVLYVEGVEVIEDELARIEKVKAQLNGNADRKS